MRKIAPFLSALTVILLLASSCAVAGMESLFSRLEVTEISVKGHKLHIKGDTDLPPGSVLQLHFDFPGLEKKPGKAGAVKVHVTPGHFFVKIDLPKGNKGADWPGFLNFSLRFRPDEQTGTVKAQVGAKGEKLEGGKVKIEKGQKILVTVKNVFL